MSLIKSKFIGSNQVGSNSIRLENNQSLKGRNAENDQDLDIVKLSATNTITLGFNNSMIVPNGNISLGHPSNRFNSFYVDTILLGFSTRGFIFSEDRQTPSGKENLGLSFLSAVDRNISIESATRSTDDANPTGSVLIETGNKTAGTGDSGSIVLTTGTSLGGNRGKVSIVARSLKLPTSDTDPLNVEAGDIYFNTSSLELKIYDGSTWIVLAAQI